MQLDRPTSFLISLFASALAASCSSDLQAIGDPGGDWGVTPGGAQDIGYARDLIERGGVPTAIDIPIEGLLSEHDLPTIGAPCDSLICLRPALGIGRHLASGGPSRFVHVGMTSGLAADFERPPLDVVLVVDKSNSMSIDMNETTSAMTSAVDKLRPQDRVAVIAFDESIYTIRELGPVGDADALKRSIKQIPADGGGFDINGATARAFTLLADSTEDNARLQRVLLFSCGFPSIDSDQSDPFSRAVKDAAALGIGTSFFGILLGYSPALTELLGETRGGSSYYLQDLERIEQVFDADFEGMVTPLAYEMQLALNIGDAFEIEKIYGIPGDADGEPRSDVEISTAFLSKRRGGIVARVSPKSSPETTGDIGSIGLLYSPEAALSFVEPSDQSAEVLGLRSSEEEYYDGDGVRIAAALVNQGERMRAACDEFHHTDTEAAIAILDELHEYLVHAADELAHEGLASEAALVDKLRSNVR